MTAAVIIDLAHPDLTWHDQQRVGQIACAVFAFVGLWTLRPARVVSIHDIWFCPALGILLIGALSSALALHPAWAVTEYALLIANVGIGAFIFCLMRQYGDQADLILGSLLRLLLAGVVLRFYVSYISALAHADLYFTPWNLLSGFTNVRFEGQFLSIVVPLLGATLGLPKNTSFRYRRGLDIFLMASLAGMVLMAGTRGTIAAWLAVSVLFWCLKRGARVTAHRMLLISALGFALTWLMLRIISWVIGQEVDNRFTDGQLLGLSAREVLWEHAWATIMQFPWLGVGPMHFASLDNPVAAHPHQALLQIASEWGVPVFLLVMVVVVTWLRRVFAMVSAEDSKPGSDLRWALLFAVCSSMVQSMVDGVLVMPYPQLWLAITVGWCAARCLPDNAAAGKTIPYWVPLLLWGLANGVLIAATIIAYPNLFGLHSNCIGGPRFWCNGSI